MKSVLIIADGQAWQQTAIAALRQAIEADGGSVRVVQLIAPPDPASPNEIYLPKTHDIPDVPPAPPPDLLCPLTTDWHKHIWQHIEPPSNPNRVIYFNQFVDLEDIPKRLVMSGYHYGGGYGGNCLGPYWLPIVHTAKGTLYGEVITTAGEPIFRYSYYSAKHRAKQNGIFLGTQGDAYHQPLHLSDRLRQPLYDLGQFVMQLFNAPPAVYLLEFGIERDIEGDKVFFEKLKPFPAAPAIASIGVQLPNLYECHWRCLSNQPIVDLAIAGTAKYETLSV